MAQCLNPNLPAGVHQKTLETYSIIFTQIGERGLKIDFALYCMGILPFFELASSLIRCKVIDLFIQNILPLGKEIIFPHLQQIILSFLPAFEEENSDFYQKAISLFDILEGFFGRKEMYKSIWSIIIMSSKHRLPSINYIIRKQPKKITQEESEDFCVSIRSSRNIPIPIVALKQCISFESDIMVVRGSLDIICLHFPLNCQWLLPIDKEILIESMLSILIRRDMTLSRRVFTWVSMLEDEEIDLISSSIRKIDSLPKIFKIISYLNDRSDLLKSILQRDIWYILETLYGERDCGGDSLISSANKFFSLVDLSMVWGLLIEHFVTSAYQEEFLKKDIEICCWAMDNLLICEDEAITDYIPMFAHALIEKFSPLKECFILQLLQRVVQEIKLPSPPPQLECNDADCGSIFDSHFISNLPSLPSKRMTSTQIETILKEIITKVIEFTFLVDDKDIETFLIIESLYKILRSSLNILYNNSNDIMLLFKGFPQRLLELDFDLRSMFAISKFIFYCNDFNSSSLIDSFIGRLWDLLLKNSDHTGSILTDDSALGIGSNVTIILLENFPEKIDKFLSGKLTHGSENERVSSLRIISHLWFGCINSLNNINSTSKLEAPKISNMLGSESSISLISSTRSATSSSVDLFPTTISIILEFLDDKYQSNRIKSAALSWYYRAIDHLPRVIDPLIFLIASEISNSSNYPKENYVIFSSSANLARISFCFKQFIALLSVNDGSIIVLKLASCIINENLIPSLPSKKSCTNLEALISIIKPFIHCNVDNYNIKEISIRLLIIILERTPREHWDWSKQLVEILQHRIKEAITEYESHPMIIYCLELIITHSSLSSSESPQTTYTELVDIIIEIFRKIDSAEVLRVWVSSIARISPFLEFFSLQRLLTTAMSTIVERIDEEISCYIAVPSNLSQRGREMWILDMLDCIITIFQISRHPRGVFSNGGNTSSSLSTSMENTTSISSNASITNSIRKEDRSLFLKTTLYAPLLLISMSKLNSSFNFEGNGNNAWLQNVRGKVLSMIDIAPGRFIRTILDYLIDDFKKKEESNGGGYFYTNNNINNNIHIDCIAPFASLLDARANYCWIHCDLIGQLENVYPSIREGSRSDSGSLLEGFLILIGRLAEECGGAPGVRGEKGIERYSERIRLLNLLSTTSKDCISGKVLNFKNFSYFIINAYLELLTDKTLLFNKKEPTNSIRVSKDVISIFNRACEMSLIILAKAADSSIFNTIDLNSIFVNGEISTSVILENIRDPVIAKLFYVILWKFIPSLSLINFEDDKILSSLVSTLCNQLLLPSFKGSNRLLLPGIISQIGFSKLCEEVSLVRWWKKEFWESVFMDAQLFHGWCLPNIMNQIVGVMKEFLRLEPDRLSDVISKVPASSSSTLFVSKEMENILRAGMIRRLSVLVISSDLEALKIILPLIQEKIVDVLRLGNNNWSSAEVFTLVKCLLFKMGNNMTTGIWPVVSTESLSLFMKTSLKDPSVAALYTWLCVCRLLEFVLRTGYPMPLMYIWSVVEIIERGNSIEIPIIIESISKLNINNENLEFSDAPKNLLDNISGRRSILPNTNIYSIEDLAPFFKYISWRVRNSCDSYSDDLSNELFEDEIINSFSDNIGSE